MGPILFRQSIELVHFQVVVQFIKSITIVIMANIFSLKTAAKEGKTLDSLVFSMEILNIVLEPTIKGEF